MQSWKCYSCDDSGAIAKMAFVFNGIYNYDIEHRKGADIQGADTLSRYHSDNADNGVFDVNNLQDTILPAPINKSRIRRASKMNPEMTVQDSLYKGV